MLKNISNLGKTMSQKELKTINGGTFLCEDICILGLRRCYVNKVDFFYQDC